MELKHLKKATHLLEEIQQLDKEILELDKFAIAINSNQILASFSLTGTKIEQEEEATPGTISLIDPAGNMTERFSGLLHFHTGFAKPKAPELQISEGVDEKLVYQLLQVIMNHKNAQRVEMLRRLSRIGVTI